MFQSFSIIVAVAALLSFINSKYLKLPTTIGLMLLALITAILFISTQYVFTDAYQFFCSVLLEVDFKTTLLDAMLSFLLFAGALHVDVNQLKEQKWPVFLFATFRCIAKHFSRRVLFIWPFDGIRN